jgi:hypothetical protein
VRENPGTVSVEVENYSVKSLIGWNRLAPIGEADLERAKKRLSEHFDFVLLTDDMSSALGVRLVLSANNTLRGLYSSFETKQKSNKSDQSTRQRFESQLAHPCSLSSLLIEKFDIELFKFARGQKLPPTPQPRSLPQEP